MAIDDSLAKGLLKRKRREAFSRVDAIVVEKGAKKGRNAWVKRRVALIKRHYAPESIISTYLEKISKKERIVTIFAIDYTDTGNIIFIDQFRFNTRKFTEDSGRINVALTDHALQRLIQSKLPATCLMAPLLNLHLVCEKEETHKGDSWCIYTLDGVFIASIKEDEHGLYALIKTIIPTTALDHRHRLRYDQYIKNKTDVYMVCDWRA